jgi:hypothetical protein
LLYHLNDIGMIQHQVTSSGVQFLARCLSTSGTILESTLTTAL